MTVPYACSYSNGKPIHLAQGWVPDAQNLAAKAGGTPFLAVATEQGSIHLINTSKRRDWDVGMSPVSSPIFFKIDGYLRSAPEDSPTTFKWCLRPQMVPR
jgi:hypothetical protein